MVRRFLALVVTVSLVAATIRGDSADPQVVSGKASFQQSGADWTITTSDQAVINWQRFDVPVGSTMQFVQPAASSLVVNRVIGPSASFIDGLLTANGRLYLINPHGITVGPAGMVRVNGFIASTLNASNAALLSGGDINFVGISAAAIENFGQIEAIGGDIYLVAAHVTNQGTVSAPAGRVGLAAGNDVLLTHDKELFVQPTHLAGAGGTGIDNSGLIEAVSAELKAHGNMYDLAINTSGVVRATGFGTEEGRVVLNTDGGMVRNAGTVAAKTVDDQGRTTGGQIVVNGRSVELTDSSVLDASGEAGGGNISVFADELAVSGTINAGSASGRRGQVLLDPAGVIVNRAAADTIEGVLQGGADLTLEAFDRFDLLADGAIDTTDGADNGATLWFKDGDGGSLLIDLKAPITLQGSQTLIGDGTEVTVHSGALIQNGIDLAATGGLVSVQGGTFSESLMVNKNLTIDGGGTTVVEGASPALTVNSGVTLTVTGQMYNTTTNDNTVVVHGTLTMTNCTVRETNNFKKAAVRVQGTGATLILGGGNTFIARGEGWLISTARPDNIDATGNTWRRGATVLTDNFRIEDRMVHGTNTGKGLVYWVADSVYVSEPGTGSPGESIQKAVDTAAAGDTIWIEGGTTFTESVTVAKDLTLDGGAAAVNAVIEGVSGGSPALTVTGGSVVVNAATLQTITPDHTVVVSGGALKLTDCTVHETDYVGGAPKAALRIWGNGSSVDLTGGGNTFNVRGNDGRLIRNSRPANIDATTDTTWQKGGDDLTNNFRIEDMMIHGPDSGAGKGVVYWKANELFVTQPTGGADESIQNAVDTATAGDTIWIEGGTFNESVTIAKNLTLDGGGAAVIEGASPALTVTAGEVVVRNGATLQTSTPDHTVVVNGGTLTLTGCTVHETTSVDGTGPYAALYIWGAGSSVDLAGGGNIFNVRGSGRLIRNARPTNIVATGNTWQKNGATLTNDFRIEDRMIHGPDSNKGTGTGVVYWQGNSLFVSDPSLPGSPGESIQNAVDVATAGDTIHLEGGVFAEDVLVDKSVSLVAQAPTTAEQWGSNDGVTMGMSGQFQSSVGANAFGAIELLGNTSITSLNSQKVTFRQNVDGAAWRLTVDAGGVDQTGGALTADELLLLGSGEFSLNQAGNDVNTLAADIASLLIYRDTDDLTVGTVAGTSGIATGGGNVRLRTGDTLTLAANVTATGARVTLRSQSGGVNQTGGALTAAKLLLLGSGNFSLNQAGNDVDMLAADIASPLTYRDADDLTVGTVGWTSGIATAGGNVTLNMGDTLTLAANVTATGARVTLNPTAGGVDQQFGSLTAAKLLLRGSGFFYLGRRNNDVNTLAADVDGTLVYRDANALKVGRITSPVGTTRGITTNGYDVRLGTGGTLRLTEDITAAGARIRLRPLSGGVNQTGGTLTAAELLLLGSGQFKLNRLSFLWSGNRIDTLAADIGSPGILNGVLINHLNNHTGGPSSLTYRDADALTVDSLNIPGGTVVGITTDGGDVTLRTGDTLTLAQNVTAPAARVTLNTLRPWTQGGVEQSGGALTADELVLRGLGWGAFNLDQANNVNTLAATTRGRLTYRDVNELTIGSLGLLAKGILGLDDVTLNTGGKLTLEQNVTAFGRVTLNSTDGVNQTGGRLKADELLLLGNGEFSLDRARNDVNTLAVNIASPLTYRDRNGLTVGTIGATSGITTAGGNVTLNTGGLLTLADNVIAVGARVTLNSAGGVNQTDGWLTAADLLLLGTGDFTLDRVFNDIDTLAANIASSLVYTDWDDVTVGIVGGVFGILTNGGHVEINAPFGQIGVNQPIDTTGGVGGILTVSGDVVLAAPVLLGAGNVTLRGMRLPGPIFQGGPDQSGDYDYLRAQWLYDHMDQLTYKELLAFKRRVEEMAGVDPRWAQLLTAINDYLEAVVTGMEKATFYKP